MRAEITMSAKISFTRIIFPTYEKQNNHKGI